MVGGLRRRLAGRRGLHGLGVRELLRRPRSRRQGGQAVADVRERLARSAAGSAARRGLPERWPRRPGDRRLEGRGAVPRPRRTRHLRRRREAGAPRLRPAGQPGVRPRVAVRRRPDVLGARAPPGARLLGVRRRPRPPGRPARPRCALLGEMEDVITAAQAEGRIAGVLLDDGETEQRFSARRLRRRRPERPRPARPDAARRRCRRTAAPAAATQRDRRQSARSVAGRRAPLRPRDRRGRGPVPPRRPGRRAGLQPGAPTSSRSTPSRRAASSPAAGCRDAP